MKPRPRVYGIETEYGTSSRYMTRLDSIGLHGREVNLMMGRFKEKTYGTGFLPNGGRFYFDRDHPEYCTPETRSAWDLALWDKAGEKIARNALGSSIQIYKDNNDNKGAIYGCHENYLLHGGERVEGILPFIVTRQIFTGTGRYYIKENEWKFRMSQKFRGMPDFNKNSSKSYSSKNYQRFEIVVGDSNMSETATWLKIGTTSLVIDLINNGLAPLYHMNHAEEFMNLSRRCDVRHSVKTQDGTISAIDMQWQYFDAISRYLEAEPGLMECWYNTLVDLESGDDCARQVDWVAKRWVAKRLIEDGWSPSDLDILDHEYHNTDPLESLFYYMQRNGWVPRLFGDEELAKASHFPPEDTRAKARTDLMGKNRSGRVGWDYVFIDGNRFELPDPLDPELPSNRTIFKRHRSH